MMILMRGGTIVIDGIINGDLIAAGGTVKISGTVNGDVIAAGGTLTIGGSVADDIRIVGGNIEIDGFVEDNAMIFGGNIAVGEGSHIGRDLNVGGGNVEIYGDVGGDLDGGGGNIKLAGTIGGDVSLSSDNVIKVLPSAEIKGNFDYSSKVSAEIPENTVMGKITHKIPTEPAPKKAFESPILSKLWGFLSLLVVGIIIVSFAPRLTLQVHNTILTSFWKSIGVGFLFLIVVPILSIILLVTIIGIPVALIILVSYIIALYVSKVFVGFSLGQIILERLKKETKSLIWPLAMGLLLIALVTSIPVIGFFVSLICIVLGFGALLMVQRGIYHELKAKQVI
ncbi:MAG: hypothetical protein QMC77_01895 [Methanocellales archaeon]|nr:hypothetical protein [Methanocellales archaeon]